MFQYDIIFKNSDQGLIIKVVDKLRLEPTLECQPIDIGLTAAQARAALPLFLKEYKQHACAPDIVYLGYMLEFWYKKYSKILYKR